MRTKKSTDHSTYQTISFIGVIRFELSNFHIQFLLIIIFNISRNEIQNT